MIDGIAPNPGERASSPRIARIGAIVWPSFFAAGVATTVFFAIVDPLELAQISWPHVAVSREVGYTIGFFMFWLCTLGSSAFTTLLLTPPRGPSAPYAKGSVPEARE